MPIEELSEGLFRGLFRFIGQFIVEVIAEIVLHKTGWLFLRLVTLGRYPPPDPRPYAEGFVIAAGIVVWAVIAALAWALFK